MLQLAVIGHVERVTFANAPFVPKPGEIVHLTDPMSQPGGGGGRYGGRTCADGRRGHVDDPRKRRPGAAGARGPRPADRGGGVGRPADRGAGAGHPARERTLYLVGENQAPAATDALPWDDLAGMDGCYFTGYDPATVVLARRARVLVVTARRFEALAASGVRADALVGSGRDRGEQYDLSRLEQQPEHVIVTGGSQGGSGYKPAPVPGPVVDTYGAGDTFVAGVLFGLASGWPLPRTLSRGRVRGGGADVAGRVAPTAVIPAC